jgi:pimeloyl-ACP methyl ester carboxylesterase
LRAQGRLPVPGAELHFETEGSEDAIVLVHGFALDTRMWDDQVPALRDVAQVVRYDARGFGRSSDPAPAVTYSHSGDLIALLDHLGITCALLVGLSMGGLIVLHTALVAAERVRGIVLLDAVLDGIEWDDESARAMMAVQQAAATDGVQAAKDLWLAHPLFLAARRHPRVAARLAAMVGAYSGFHWTQDDPCTPLSPPPVEVLEHVAVPTTVVVGELDVPCFRTMAGVLADRIPGARTITVRGAGHMVNMEAPDIVNAVLREAVTTTT